MDVSDKPVIMVYNLPRFKVEMKITICDGESTLIEPDQRKGMKILEKDSVNQGTTRHQNRIKDVSPKEIKFSQTEMNFAESHKLFGSLLRNWEYGPHKYARMHVGPTYKPKCFFIDWKTQCIAGFPYSSIDQIRQ